MMSSVTLTITDPRRRTFALAVHPRVSKIDARELVAVYVALDHPLECINIEPAGEAAGREPVA